MNSKPISSYEDLCKEKERLAELLKAQKTQIHRDLDEIKGEFRPMLIFSENVSKLLSREDGKDPIVAAGTNIGIDLLAAKLFSLLRFALSPFVRKGVGHGDGQDVAPFCGAGMVPLFNRRADDETPPRHSAG